MNTRFLTSVLLAIFFLFAPPFAMRHATAQDGAAPPNAPETGSDEDAAEELPADDAPAETDGADAGAGAASAEESESSAGDAAPETTPPAAEDETIAPPGHTVSYQPPADEAGTTHFILPPYFHERRGDVTTTVVFPLFARRTDAHDAQMLVGPYYQRRGAILRADVLFPVFWSFRGANSVTWVVPPVYSRTRAEGFDFGIAPLFFSGRTNNSVYTVIPELLTVAWANEDHAHTFAGPFWRIRDHENEDWGIFPVLWTSQHESFSRVISPLYLHFTSEENQSELTIVPPLLTYHRTTDTGAAYGVAPIFFHAHDRHGSALTIPPLVFHYSHEDDGSMRLVTPLFGYANTPTSSTFISWLYQRHRGVTELDSVAPLFFSMRDPREHSSTTVLPLLLSWHHESPAEVTTVIGGPLFVHVGETGRFDTYFTPLAAHYRNHERDRAGTWIFPNIEVSHTEQSQTFNIHPVLYETQARTHRHFVLAPLVWNFENERTDSATTIFAPLFWRFRNHDTVSQLAVNTYWHETRQGGVHSWEFHFFPLFAFGENAPGDTWWNVLYGLVGYQRQGSYAQMKLFYIPFQVDGPSASDPPSVAPAQTANDGIGTRFN